jgi:signal transduction histidine kinase
MDERPVRVLLVEDDEDDFVLTRDLLAEGGGGRYALDWVADYDRALQEIAGGAHDLYLIDYRLGRHTGLDLIREAVSRGCRAPFILQTGEGDSAIDLEAMRAGAVDFLVKDELNGPTLERAVRYALERKRAEDALREAREELERRVEERTGELTAANQRLAEANQRLAEADRRKDEFLATLAHELRNPLAPVRNALHLLRHRDMGDVPVDDLLAMLDRQVTHLTHLVDDLMDVSRITRGRVELRRQRVDLAALAAGTAAAVRPLLDQRQHRFEVEVPPGPLWVSADPTRVEQILTNLLTNAGKYTPPGGRVCQSVRPEGAEAVVRVSDNGIGIRPEMLPRIFDMFQQADRVPGRVTDGLGIGLTLVRRLVELHGGRVEAHSVGPGRGSEFVVRLPVAADEPAPRPGEARGQSPDRLTPSARRRVLIVDDNADAANTLALVLRAAGHAVRVAHDGRAALAAAGAAPPEVVLLDIGLPHGMTGYEVARRLRDLPGANGMTLIALTGYGAEEYQRRAAEAGFDHYLTKPVDLDELRELLAQPGPNTEAPSPESEPP